MDTIAETALDDDLHIFQQIAAGDLSAFDRLMRRYNQRLYRTARSILHNDMDAEEAVQDAWWKAFQHLGEFRAESRPSTWLTRIVVNEALMRLRRNKSHDAIIQLADNEPDTPNHPMSPSNPATTLPDSQQPDQQAWRAEMRRLIETHVNALPDLYRAVFMLRGVEDMPSAEVATILDIPEATVRVRYMRARRLLQDSLKDQLDPHVHDAFSFAGERCDRIVAGVHARMRAAGLPVP
ncbi:RNA polymerase sigma factor [Castellaniella sp.]|uniref:RNA polymerase sigma factor n=1 Tax=Castellaniella sp. TaxID=1955812 RepID=UPI002AFF7E00|nr:RNA polymerase sigma factor [Castellaniella sp.]